MASPVLWHTLGSKAIFQHVESSLNGLSDAEIKRRLGRYGFNELPKQTIVPWWRVLFSQLASPLLLVLMAAAVISGLLADWIDVAVIVAAIIVNTVIGFLQELKANRSLAHLQALVQPITVVIRNGREREIAAKEVVPGDILVLRSGDQITADARLLDAFALSLNEAPLTGESLPIEKRTNSLVAGTVLAERINMVYAGTSVMSGSGKAVVVATGMRTEVGRIASLISQTRETPTPLQQQLTQLARWMAALVLGIVVILFVMGTIAGRGVVEMFEMSVALAVAAIPEGLVVSVTIILAIGMQRILKRRSLVRRLVAAETLGSVSVICSDKTGTITEGNMSVVSVVTAGQTFEAKQLRGQTHRGMLLSLLEALILCNDAKTTEGDQREILKGSPTERALFNFAVDVGIDPTEASKRYPRISDYPFDSARKYHLTQHVSDHEWKVIAIGAPSKIFDACRLTQEERVYLQHKEQTYALDGLRLVAVAMKTVRAPLQTLDGDDFHGFRFLGMLALQDPLRSDIAAHIKTAHKAGIRTVLITGDHPQTAATIARQAGLTVSPESVVVGSTLDQWSDDELQRRITRVSVFARVEPRHKIRIVQAWQARGEVVAMTGDGVNDAPALKAADIGICVGTGTEVAKQSSDLVLLDNNFATITAAVEEGRVIFDNIRKSTAYLLSDSFSEVILIAGAILFGLPVPLLPTQILWINLVADSFPNIGLTLEPGEKDVLSQRPRLRGEPVLNKEMFTVIFTIGIITDVILLLLYVWLLNSRGDVNVVRSIMFAAVGIDSLIYVFAMKSFRRTIFRINPFSNPWLLGGVGIGFLLMFLALISPFFQTIFAVSPLHLSDWGLLLMIGILKLLAIECVKEWFLFKKRYEKIPSRV